MKKVRLIINDSNEIKSNRTIFLENLQSNLCKGKDSCKRFNKTNIIM